MSQTTTTIGRLGLADPDRQYDTLDGGVALHAQLRSNWTQVANHLMYRFLSTTLANSASTAIVHNFSLNLSKLRYTVFEAGVQLTAAQVATNYTIAETGGSSTTSITITNISGSSKTFLFSLYAGKLGIETGDFDGAASFTTTGTVRAGALETTGDTLVLNHGASESVADWKTTVTRNTTTQAANITLTLPPTDDTIAGLAQAQTWTALQTVSAGLAVTGGTAANNTIYSAGSQMRLRGGTSGLAFYNTSAAEIFTINDAGSPTFGPTGAVNLAASFRTGADLSVSYTTSGNSNPATFTISRTGTTSQSWVFGMPSGSRDFKIESYTGTGSANGSVFEITTQGAFTFAPAAGLASFHQMYGSTTANSSSFDLIGNQFKLGSDLSAVTRTNATSKTARIVASHYSSSSEEDLIMFKAVSSSSSAATLSIGGNDAAKNTFTAIEFYTAANSTTLTGTLAGSIDSTTAWSIGAVAGIAGSHTMYGSTSGALASLDIYGNNFKLGGINAGGVARTDATSKRARFLMPHYTNAEEDFAIAICGTDNGSTFINLGGGSSAFNTTTLINFYTGSTSTTVTGTINGSLTSQGIWTLGAVGSISCQLVGSQYSTIGFNGFYNGSYVANVTGYVSFIQGDNTNGGAAIYAAPASTTGGAAVTTANIGGWNKDGAFIIGPSTSTAIVHTLNGSLANGTVIPSYSSATQRYIGNKFSSLSFQINDTATGGVHVSAGTYYDGTTNKRTALNQTGGRFSVRTQTSVSGALFFFQSDASISHAADSTNTFVTIGQGTAEGSWTFGGAVASSTATHRFNGRSSTIATHNEIVSFATNNAATGDMIVRIGGDPAAKVGWISSTESGVGVAGMRFGAFTTDVGGYTSAGIWSLGASSITSPHTVYGGLSSVFTTGTQFWKITQSAAGSGLGQSALQVINTNTGNSGSAVAYFEGANDTGNGVVQVYSKASRSGTSSAFVVAAYGTGGRLIDAYHNSDTTGVSVFSVSGPGSVILNPPTGNGIYTSVNRLFQLVRTTNVNVAGNTTINTTQMGSSAVNSSYIRMVTASGAFNLDGITPLSDGTILTVENQSGQVMTVRHNGAGEGTSANQINTSTAASFTFADGAVAILMYSSGKAKWLLINRF